MQNVLGAEESNPRRRRDKAECCHYTSPEFRIGRTSRRTELPPRQLIRASLDALGDLGPSRPPISLHLICMHKYVHVREIYILHMLHVYFNMKKHIEIIFTKHLSVN